MKPDVHFSGKVILIFRSDSLPFRISYSKKSVSLIYLLQVLSDSIFTDKLDFSQKVRKIKLFPANKKYGTFGRSKRRISVCFFAVMYTTCLTSPTYVHVINDK